MTISFRHPEFHASVAEVRRVADELRTARSRAGGQVAELLDGGWHGAAATAFAEAWTDWLRASGEVTEGLGALAELLAAVHADLSERDEDARAALDRVAGRLG